jgi:replicative DNA helicase
MHPIDVCLCVHILRDGALKRVNTDGVSANDLFDDGKKIFLFVLEHFAKYGKIPDPTTVETDIKIPVPPMAEAPEKLDYYLDQIKKRTSQNLLKEATKGMSQKLEALDSTGAIDQAKGVLREVFRRGLVGETVSNWTDRVDERVARYDAIVNLPGGLIGLPTPWKGINDMTQGIGRGELWILVGRPSTGKTWHAIKIAQHLWQEGYKPLFITMEMLKERIEMRMDALYAKVPYRDLRKGTLGMHLKDKFKAAMDTLKGKPPMETIGRRRIKTVQDISILIEETAPSIVILDGLYKLRPNGQGFRAKWEQVTQIIDDLQELTQDKGIPVLATTQFSREHEKSKKGKNKRSVVQEAGLEQLAFADAIGMNADVVIGLLTDSYLKSQNEVILSILKNREDEKKSYTSKFDLTAMDFNQTGEYGGLSGDSDVSAPTAAVGLGGSDEDDD